jgi:hypothetical protein
MSAAAFGPCTMIRHALGTITAVHPRALLRILNAASPTVTIFPVQIAAGHQSARGCPLETRFARITPMHTAFQPMNMCASLILSQATGTALHFHC